MASLCVFKIHTHMQYCVGFGGFPTLAPLFAFFNPQANGPFALELFEIDVEVVTTDKDMQYAITDSVHQWDKLDQDLASHRFPRLRQVNVAIHASVLHRSIKPMEVKKKMTKIFQNKLSHLHCSPSVAVIFKLMVRNHWDMRFEE